MRKAIISDAIGNMDSRFVAEVADYKPSAKLARPSVWVKITAVAACIVLTVTLGISFIHNRPIGSDDHIVTIENGKTLRFVKHDADQSVKLSFSDALDSRELTGDEIGALFGHLPVNASAHFDRTDHRMIGVDGNIGDVKLMVATDAVMSNTTPPTANGHTSFVNGVSISAGYYLTEPDGESGERVVYYATFELGDNTVYVEHAGATEDSEASRTELTAIILLLIDNGAIDMAQITLSAEGFTPPVTIPIIPGFTMTDPPVTAPHQPETTAPETPITLPIG